MQQLNSQSQNMLKSEVNLVNGTIAALNQQVQSDSLSLTTAQNEVKEMILGSQQQNGHRPMAL